MKKTVLVLSAAVALSVMTAPVALAQNTGPDTNACEKARIAEGDALNLVRDAERALRDVRENAKKVVEPTGSRMEPPFDGTATVTAAEQAAIDAAKGKLERLQKDLDKAVDKREEKCADPAPTTTTTPPPTTVIEDNDVDCDEVSDSEAQRILNADRSDPNNLDTDNDGVACEEEIVLNPPPTVNVVVPEGGVATGVGPA